MSYLHPNRMQRRRTPLGFTGTKLAAKLKIQAKMTIWKTARFFYLIFLWKLVLNTYRGLGCTQFMWSIFFEPAVAVGAMCSL